MAFAECCLILCLFAINGQSMVTGIDYIDVPGLKSTLLSTAPEIPESMTRMLDFARPYLVGENTMIGKCYGRLYIKPKCQYLVVQDRRAEKCDFFDLAFPLIMKEAISVARSRCGGSYGIRFEKLSTNVNWAISVRRYRGNLNVHANVSSMIMKNIIKMPKGPVRFVFNRLFPKTINDVALSLVKNDRKTLWMGLQTKADHCVSEVLVRKSKRKSGLIVSNSCNKMNLWDFLADMTKVDILKKIDLSFLFKIPFTSLFSTINANPAKDTKKSFRHLNMEIMKVGHILKHHFGISATVRKPRTCENIFCTFLKETIFKGNDKMRITGSVGSRDFKLVGHISNEVNLSDNVYMKNIKLTVESVSASAGLGAQLCVPEIALELEASIGLGPSGLRLHASKRGMWKNAFGIEYMAVKDLLVSATLAPMPKGFQFGGTFYFGTVSLENRVYLEIHGGFGTPGRNYFYGKSNLALGRLIGAFGGSGLPGFLEDTGFPNGAQVSYTKSRSEVRVSNDLVIKPGMRIVGEFEILKLRADIDITVHFNPLRIDLNIELPVIKLGNVLRITRSKHSNDGPIAKVELNVRDPLAAELKAEGYFQLFGVNLYVNIEVKDKQLSLETETSLFDLLEAKIKITVAYSNILSAGVTAYVEINEGFTEMAKSLGGKLSDHLKEGKKKLQVAQNKLKEAKDKCRETFKADCDKCKNEVFSGFCSGISTAACYTECTFSTLLFSNAHKQCNRDCDRAKDNECDKELTKACKDMCKTAEQIGQGLCEFTSFAQIAVRTVEKEYGKIVRFAIKGLGVFEMFMINQITFETEISTSNLGRIQASITFTILKKRHQQQVTIDLKNIAAGVEDEINKLFEKVYAEVKVLNDFPLTRDILPIM